MIIEAFHKTTGQRLILEYATLKEAIGRTGHYLRNHAVLDSSSPSLKPDTTPLQPLKSFGDTNTATPLAKTV